VRDGDFVSVVIVPLSIPFVVRNVSEVFSVYDFLQAGIHSPGNEFVDQLIKCFSDFLGGFDGGVD